MDVLDYKRNIMGESQDSESAQKATLFVDELQRSILRRAALIQKEQSENKKKKGQHTGSILPTCGY